MNTNPSAKRIVCFGDSNTWGSGDSKHERVASDKRWTGCLQTLLGDNYAIIEEGYCGRTTDLDDGPDGRNGETYLPPMLKSQSPIDVLVLMLGTNDTKVKFNRSSDEIAASLEKLVRMVPEKTSDEAGSPKVLLVSPIHINHKAPLNEKLFGEDFPEAAAVKSHEFADKFKSVAGATGVAFLDAGIVARPGEDGLHLSQDSHAPIAAALAPLIKELCRS